ncbi:MAG TPA: acetyltransferase [Hyphomicrobium sp.]|uniref:acetyltransferase n=1 Tax=Hyphomicrobium sp. TaxID=82 RepID=UPI002C0D87B8|nr:acetyltransferase [Hyphomicrobium sp.]HRN87725.1 acetyltransferase [Hyphomicrobium sp.]
MKRLLILGCGGHGRVVADTALDAGYASVAFLDDAAPRQDGPVLPGPVLGPMSAMADLVDEWESAISSVGNNDVRLSLFRQIRNLAFRTPAIVHPSAVVSRQAVLADGVFVAPGAVIGVGARIGEASIVNTGARIDHDCFVGDGCHIAPGATLSGNVKIGERAWLGTGCCVRQGTTIGDDVVVGVGAAVVSDLSPGKTYVGVPARPMKIRNSG